MKDRESFPRPVQSPNTPLVPTTELEGAVRATIAAMSGTSAIMAAERAEHAGPEVASLSFAQVFADHAPGVWRTLRNLGVPEADLQDACQDAFVIVHRKLAGFRGQSSVRTWIYGICLRVAAARRRRAHRRHEVLVEELPIEAVAADPEREFDLRSARALLEQIVMSLDEAKRQVFVLHEIEQMPMAEIAEAMGCPLRTAYSRLEAARRSVMHAWNRAMVAPRRER
jgi:RNA polymerase sigma-70 factor (ECF subfamily)